MISPAAARANNPSRSWIASSGDIRRTSVGSACSARLRIQIAHESMSSSGVAPSNEKSAYTPQAPSAVSLSRSIIIKSFPRTSSTPREVRRTRLVLKSTHELSGRHHPYDRAPMRPAHSWDPCGAGLVRLFDECVGSGRKLATWHEFCGLKSETRVDVTLRRIDRKPDFSREMFEPRPNLRPFFRRKRFRWAKSGKWLSNLIDS